MRAIIARCEAVNPKVNATTYTFFERALKAARQAEVKYNKKSGRPRALEGIEVDSSEYNEDLHADAEYRANLVKVMAQRAVEDIVS